MGTKKCPQCGTEQDTSYKFCKNCGYLMDFSYSHIQGIDISKYLQTTNNTTKQCHYCGTEQDSSYKFCKNCGALLSNENTMEPSIDDLINDAKDYSDIFLEDDIKDNVKIVSKSDKSYSDNKNSADVKIIDETDDESISLPFYYSQKFKLTDKSLKTCPKCGSKTHNDNFCVYCGYKLNLNPKKDYKSVHCIYCGSILDEDDIYCTNCGKLVGVNLRLLKKYTKALLSH